ncbi:alpha/beta hydrolase [Chryseobacterium sp. FH2]|uniref:alpha/beta hydrolase n=1 Tax=Chryseobacterium sp. FH2 TaxID=1674291 RepID=UPI000AB7FC75|nr:alpha/beta hydrolase [Chryseobacterium sp. FH2]
MNLNKNISFDVQNDISYGKDSEQKLDLYIPKNDKQNQNVFIIVHGGGWRGGKKSDLTFFTRSLMEKLPNSVFANIEYRLASTTRFAIPAQTDDIHSVMLYLEKELRYKPNFILLGNSAGGHLSMLYAYKFDKEKNVKAVINIVGPADLSDRGFKSYVDYSFVENHLIEPKLVDKNIQKEKFTSPVYWINQTSAPTLSFYGNNDQIVPVSQKKILDSALNKNNVFYESFEFTGDHMGWTKEPNDIFLINKISDFLKNLSNKKAH